MELLSAMVRKLLTPSSESCRMVNQVDHSQLRANGLLGGWSRLSPAVKGPGSFTAHLTLVFWGKSLESNNYICEEP